jgi:hypothetical protein
MRRVLIAVAILAVTALPSFADDAASQPACRSMQQHTELRQEMMRNPDRLLMRGYHENLMTFGHILADVARGSDTVPPDLARTAVAEMRHSVQQIEMHRPMAMRTLPAKIKQDDMQKVMDQHLIDIKTHLTQLEELTRSNRVPSQEVLKHLQPIFEGCQKMGCGAMRDQGRNRCWMQEKKGTRDCGRPMGMADGGGGCGGCLQCMGMKPPGGHPAMQEMVQEMKHQDAEMASQVKKMQHASGDKKVDLMAGIVAELVQRSADVTSHMDKMQHHMMHNRPGMHQGCADCATVPPPPPGTPMYRDGEGPYDESDYDTDDVETDDVVGY